MARYALVNPSNTINRMSEAVDPTVQTKTGYRWLPCNPVARPVFDPAVEIVDGPTYVVNANDVTEVWSKRNLTAQEVSDVKDAQVNALNGSSVNLKILRNHENRIRLLENAQFGTSKPPLSLAEVAAAIKALI